ncbi:MAG: TIGR03016 family PEP-CTERM system-associated outer membrane protein [Desulfuromonadaceae bacterium]|nr:TIGR03016 family PEP-CTERM system-associated outer membrane protein [Desulfuromonadaceae bacterium]
MPKLLRGAIFFSILSVATVAQGAEFELHPSLAVSEEFTDNVFETPTNRISDYITRALPGVVASYRAPQLNGNIDYVFDYRHYANGNHKDEITHALNANGHLIAVKNFIFLDVSDEYQRVSLDVTRDVTSESLFLNQSDRNVVTVAPYFTIHPTERLELKSGYRFIDTRYFGSSSIGVNKADHVASLDIACELSKRFSLTAGYTFTKEVADIGNYTQHQALGGFRYEYADKSFLFAQAGNAWTHYDSGQRLSNIIWNAGFTHAFDIVTVTVSTGVKYDEDPLRNIVKESFVTGIIDKSLNRGTVSFSPYYSEYALSQSNILQTKKYGVMVRGQYELTTNLKSNLALTAEKYEQRLLESYTRRLEVNSGLSYLLAEQLTVSLSHIYVEYYSPGIVYDNRHVNRAMIEIKKIF